MKVFAPTQQPSIRDANPQGRIDVGVLRLLEMLVKQRVEPAFKNKPALWDSGLGDFVEVALTESKVLPTTAITARDVWKALFGTQRRIR